MKQSVANPVAMKRHNLNNVMNGIRKGGYSRADLARELGLTRATVTNLVEDLTSRGLVTEHPSDRVAVGRTPNILRLVPEAVYFGGIWLTRGASHVCIADFEGNIVSTAGFKQAEKLPWQTRADELIASLEAQIASLGIPRERIFAVGVGAPGPIDRENGAILASPGFDEWRNVPITAYVKEKTGFDAYLEKDVGALAMAEKHLGAAKETDEYMQLFIERGIGLALVREGRLYRGVCGFEGEIGHTTVDLHGEKCVCGRRGCLELYASIPALTARAEKSLQITSRLGCREFMQIVRDGNEHARTLLEEEADYLAAGIADAVRMTGVTDIFVSGEMTRGSDLLFPLLETHFASDRLFRTPVTFRDSALGDNAHLVAAAGIAADRYFERFY